MQVMRTVLADEPEAGLKVFTTAKPDLIPTAEVSVRSQIQMMLRLL